MTRWTIVVALLASASGLAQAQSTTTSMSATREAYSDISDPDLSAAVGAALATGDSDAAVGLIDPIVERPTTGIPGTPTAPVAALLALRHAITGPVRSPAELEVCGVAVGCPRPLRIAVDGSSSSDGGKLFRSIASALSWANIVDACVVEVVVWPGTYVEDIEITRPTCIVGTSKDEVTIAGSIRQRTNSRLDVLSLTLDAGHESPALTVDAPYAWTRLEDVLVVRGDRYGIRQRGGDLRLHDVVVQQTRAAADNVRTGYGLRVDAGGRVECYDTIFLNNEGGGVAASDSGTEVRLKRTIVSDNRYNPHFVSAVLDDPTSNFTAAVDIDNGALLLADLLRIIDNEMGGLQIARGSLANVQDFLVAGTRPRESEDGSILVGGVNILIAHASLAELHGFESLHGIMGLVLSRAFATASNYKIIRNESGLVLDAVDEDTGWDVSCLVAEDTFIYDNATDVQVLGEGLRIPDPGSTICSGDSCTDPTEPWCPEVPFDW